MIREGDYKLIMDLLDGKKELYNLAEDPGETKNIINSQDRKSYEMEMRLRKWMEAVKTNPDDFKDRRERHIEIFKHAFWSSLNRGLDYSKPFLSD